MDMTMKRLWLLLFALGMPLVATAASLGSLKVFSLLGEPLDAEISVNLSESDVGDKLVAGLASDVIYQSEGINPLPVLKNIKFSFETKDAGKATIKLKTSEAVHDPLIDIIVSLAAKDGIVLREYNIMLDTNAQIAAGTLPSVNNTKSENPAPTVTEAPQPQNKPSSDASNASHEENHPKPSAPEEVVSKLAQNAAEAQLSDEASSQIEFNDEAWQKYQDEIASQVEGPKHESSPSSKQSGKVLKRQSQPVKQDSEAPRNVLKLSKSTSGASQSADADQVTALKDDVTAKQNEIADIDDKTQQVEKQLKDIQASLDIKNKAMADAQKQASEHSSMLSWAKVVPSLKAFYAQWRFALWTVLAILLSIILVEKQQRKRRDARLPIEADREESVSNTVDSDIPEVKSVDLSGISLDFEPVEAPADVPVAEALIEDPFNEDLSNVISIDSKKSSKRGRKSKASLPEGEDIQSKLDMAAAYIVMEDKRGAKRLLRDVLKHGDELQKTRAQNLIDSIK
jgi:FimV-like protein